MSDIGQAMWLVEALPLMSEREAAAWLENWPYDRDSKRVAEMRVGRYGHDDAARRN